MKRTIRRRTEITIESLEITTIRCTAAEEVSNASGDDGRIRLAGDTAPEHNQTRLERARQLLRRKTK